MKNELNIMYDPKDRVYVLLTKQHDESTKNHDGYLYLSRIEMKGSIDYKRVSDEINKLNIKEAYLDLDALNGYEMIDEDTLFTIKRNIKKNYPDIWLTIRGLKEDITQP